MTMTEGTEPGVIHFVYDYDPGNSFCSMGNSDWCDCRIGAAHFRNCFMTEGIGLFIMLDGGGVL